MLDANIAKVGYDATFTLDAFGKPKVIEEIDVVKNTILYVLFSKPGQYPSIPDIGLDISNMLYAFYDDIDEDELKQEIISQCGALGIFFEKGNIQIRKIKYHNQPSLMIHIEGERSSQNYHEKDLRKYQIGITFNELQEMIYNVASS